jgi:hypothetical protein
MRKRHLVEDCDRMALTVFEERRSQLSNYGLKLPQRRRPVAGDPGIETWGTEVG